MTPAPTPGPVLFARRLPAVLVLVAGLFGCAPTVPPQGQAAQAPVTEKSVCTATADGFAPDRGLGGTGAPIAVATRGIGGTGAATQLADRGIGGTGAPVRLADRGIGGTGAPVGVKGTVTGFASVCVNGLEIGYDPAASINIDGVALPATELRVGQVVNLRATAGPGAMLATDMTVRHAVSGPIEEVDNGGINLVVAGQAVLLGVASPGADQLRPGQWVEVSGLRHPAGYIVAARVDLREPGQVVITGLVSGHPGALRIGGARLSGSLGASTANTSLSVSGDYADRVLTVHHVIAADQPTQQAGMIYVEAFAKATQTANGAPAVQIGDDITAELAPGFGEAPSGSKLLVLALRQSLTGGLTAVAQFDGLSSSGSATTATATTATALAPHATTTTAIATSTTASSTASAKSAAVAPAPAKATVTTSGSSKSATTGAPASGTSTSAAGKGGTTGAAPANSASAGSAAAGKGGTSGTGTSGTGTSGTGTSGTGTSGTGTSSGGGGAAASPTKK